MEIKKGIFFLFLSSNFMKHRRNIHRSVWKLLAYRLNSKWRYHGNRDTKIMGRGDVRYCFAMAILVYYCHGILYQFDLSISTFLQVEAGPCFGHECAEGSTCYVLKNGTTICLKTGESLSKRMYMKSSQWF